MTREKSARLDAWVTPSMKRGMPSFMDGVTQASSRALFSRVVDGLLA